MTLFHCDILVIAMEFSLCALCSLKCVGNWLANGGRLESFSNPIWKTFLLVPAIFSWLFLLDTLSCFYANWIYPENYFMWPGGMTICKTELILWDTVQYMGPKMAAVFLLTDTCVAAAYASGFAPCTWNPHSAPTHPECNRHPVHPSG
jgi:hypothetical protein